MNAGRAAVAAYNEKDFSPVREWGWETYPARLARYHLYTAYLNNTAYSNIQAMAAQLKLTNRLYKHIRGIYNPVARQNQLLKSYIYGGSIDYEHLTGGAIPLVLNNPNLYDPIKQLFIDSRWGEKKSLYVRWGASLGDNFIKIIDDRAKEKVRMEVLHPGKVREAEFDDVGNVKSVIIEYERFEEPDIALMKPSRLGSMGNINRLSKVYTYTEKIDKDKFQTFKNGEPFAYYTDANGDPIDEWDNEYGFVPLVKLDHDDTGLKWGANAFYNSLRKIDEINDQASLANDQIRKILIPLLYGTNIKKKSDIAVAMEDKDAYTILYGPENSTLTPISAQINIEGALKNIIEMQHELERDLPELALQSARERGGDFTAPGIQAVYSDAIGRINEARGNYDTAQVRAIKMGISIGGYNGYEGYQGFNLMSYEQGDLDFYIKDRPVVSVSLSTSDKLTALQSINSMSPALQRLALKELDYSDEDIEAVVADTEEQTRNAARGFAKSVFGDEDEEDNQDNPDSADEDQEEAEVENAEA